MNDLSTISHLLVCPACRGGLGFTAANLTCASCGRIFPVVQGIPRLALFSDGSEDPPETAGGSTGAYERRYQDFERARSYNLKYEREILKRLTTRRECRLLGRLLGRAGARDPARDPCGGRISARYPAPRTFSSTPTSDSARCCLRSPGRDPISPGSG
jgi:hypothetical protein